LKPAWANSSERPYLQKPFTKIVLVEWLKVKFLSSNSSATKNKKERKFKKPAPFSSVGSVPLPLWLGKKSVPGQRWNFFPHPKKLHLFCFFFGSPGV
jgi:hypothetical protein